MSMGAAISLTIVAGVPLLMLGLVIAATVMAALKDRKLRQADALKHLEALEYLRVTEATDETTQVSHD